MKILRNILITSLIMSAFVSLAYAAVDQKDETVRMLSGKYGFDSASKRLLLNRARAEAVLDDTTFMPNKAKSDGAKNAKSFMRSVLREVVKEFEGRTTPSKDLFLAALDEVTHEGDLEVDIFTANFATANKPSQVVISAAAKLVSDALGTIDTVLESLHRAQALNIKASTADGKTAESLLAQYDTVKAEPAKAKQLLRYIEAMKFGKSERSLAEKVAARVAKHGAMGKYSAVGVDQDDDDAMGAFHEARRSAREEGAKSCAGLNKTFAVAIYFAAKMKQLFDDGILEGNASFDVSKPGGYANMLKILSGLGVEISDLQAQVANLKGRK